MEIIKFVTTFLLSLNQVLVLKGPQFFSNKFIYVCLRDVFGKSWVVTDFVGFETLRIRVSGSLIKLKSLWY